MSLIIKALLIKKITKRYKLSNYQNYQICQNLFYDCYYKCIYYFKSFFSIY